jgi:hypothetical protein
MPPIVIKIQTGMFTGYSQIKQDDIVVQSAPDGCRTAHKDMHQSLFG